MYLLIFKRSLPHNSLHFSTDGYNYCVSVQNQGPVLLRQGNTVVASFSDILWMNGLRQRRSNNSDIRRYVPSDKYHDFALSD